MEVLPFSSLGVSSAGVYIRVGVWKGEVATVGGEGGWKMCIVGNESVFHFLHT